MDIPDQFWQTPPAHPALYRNEIQVWRAELDQPADRVEELSLHLAEDEIRRAARFHRERDRRRFIVGRGVLRRILGLYLRLQPTGVQFGYGTHGKPCLAMAEWGAGLEFNLAHAGNLVLYAFSRRGAIGIDVEQLRPLPNMGLIGAKFFSAGENAAYAALPAEEKELGFYHCWVRKEAYLKALGEGLARPPEQVEVSLAPGKPAQLLHMAGAPDEAGRWSLVSLAPMAGYVAALAAEGNGRPITCWDYERLPVGI
jgi:4'-phosphopantetheinyl transferase